MGFVGSLQYLLVLGGENFINFIIRRSQVIWVLKEVVLSEGEVLLYGVCEGLMLVM